MAALEGMSQLEHLHLMSRWTINPGYLSGLTGLKELYFDEPWVDGELFPVLASLPVLEKVTLSVEYLYQDIGRLLELSSLRELHLIPDSFSTDTLYVRMGALPVNPNLKTLSLNGFKIHDMDVENQGKEPYFGTRANEFLSHFSGLEELELRSNQLQDLEFARSMPELRILDISDNYVTDVQALLICPRLEKLICKDNQIRNLEILPETVEVVQ